MNPNANQGSNRSFDPAADEEKTMPLGIGDFSEQGLDPLGNADEKRRFNTGYLVLVVVVAIAGAGLWLMRTVSQVRAAGGAGDAEMVISDFLKRLQGKEKPEKSGSGNDAKADASVLTVLSETYTQRQVPLADIKCNPFILDGEDSDVIDTPIPHGDPKPKAIAAMREKFEKAGSLFELKSVIMSASPLANVSGKIVRVGDELVSSIDDLPFRVSEITVDSCTLVGEEPVLNLTVPVTIMLKRNQ